MSSREIHSVPMDQVERAIKLSYAQMMLSAIFAASTGGMFLIGFALELGATDILLGWMSAIPQAFVIVQLLAAYFIERGFSRKRLTVIFSMMAPACWLLIAAIPFFVQKMTVNQSLALLTGVICLVMMSMQFANNARASWVGELIPAERRGRFFGYCSLFAGLVACLFAVIEGRFLDIIRARGLFAFTGLFFFGAIFGLISAILNIHQPDCPLPGSGQREPFPRIIKNAIRNRPLVTLVLGHGVLMMGVMAAAPFLAAYCLRDVGISFFGMGIMGAIWMASMLAFSPLFGIMADRFGGRPILLLGLFIQAPGTLVWLLIPPQSPDAYYTWLPWASILSGAGGGAIAVSVSFLLYKISKPERRSVQFALYNIFVLLVSAPMPVLGAWLVSTLQARGWSVDLRLTFYLAVPFTYLAAMIIRRVQEPESMQTRVLVFNYFPNEMARFWGTTLVPYMTSLVRFQFFLRRKPKDRPPE